MIEVAEIVNASPELREMIGQTQMFRIIASGGQSDRTNIDKGNGDLDGEEARVATRDEGLDAVVPEVIPAEAGRPPALAR